jgi:hypothetical protein
MKISKLSRYAVSFCTAVTMLADCGGAQSPVGAPGTMPQSQAMARYAEHGRSWMLPEAKGEDLLYISDQGTNDVYVYSYPQGKLVGTLTGFDVPTGLCADEAGDVFIPNGFGADIVEYAHRGKSPIATLSDAGKSPSGCGVDPKTGNLAVANYCSVNASGHCTGHGSVAIYANAMGSPTQHIDHNISNVYFCGYDTKGNLFLDGTQNSAFAFAELRSGKSIFTKIALNQAIQTPGNVQWDGTEVAVGDIGTGVIYQFTISGESGTEVGSTPLTGSSYVTQFWIQPPKVIGPNVYSSGGNVLFWKYPAGGSPTKTIGGLSKPVGATVSLAQ